MKALFCSYATETGITEKRSRAQTHHHSGWTCSYTSSQPGRGTWCWNSHPGVLSSPEMHRNPKPALRLPWKLQITPVFAGVLIKLIAAGLSEFIPSLHRTCCTMNFKGHARLKRLMLFLLIFFLIQKNELIPPQKFQGERERLPDSHVQILLISRWNNLISPEAITGIPDDSTLHLFFKYWS